MWAILARRTWVCNGMERCNQRMNTNCVASHWSATRGLNSWVWWLKIGWFQMVGFENQRVGYTLAWLADGLFLWPFRWRHVWYPEMVNLVNATKSQKEILFAPPENWIYSASLQGPMTWKQATDSDIWTIKSGWWRQIVSVFRLILLLQFKSYWHELENMI